MGWITCLTTGFKIASAILSLWNQIQEERRFVERHNGLNAEARVKALEEIARLEDTLRLISDPVKLREKFETDVASIRTRVLAALPGQPVADIFGTAPKPPSS